MNGELCLVAVDVGNTAVKFAVRRGTTITDHSIRIESAEWELAALHWVADQLGCSQWQWRIASVHRSAADRLTTAIRGSEVNSSIRLVTRHDVPIDVDVDHPDRLGIDRLLSAFAAINRIESPAVVIDAGSAITVDWVSENGVFCGGAILPGLGLQSAALATGTEALPRIEWHSPSQIRLPAKNTTDAIRSGILTGIAASIDALIQRYSLLAGLDQGQVRVVLTGGDSSTISAHLRHNHELMPNLVCRGLLELPRSEAKDANTRKQVE